MNTPFGMDLRGRKLARNALKALLLAFTVASLLPGTLPEPEQVPADPAGDGTVAGMTLQEPEGTPAEPAIADFTAEASGLLDTADECGCAKLTVVVILDYPMQAYSEGNTYYMIKNFFETLRKHSPDVQVQALSSPENIAACRKGEHSWDIKCVDVSKLTANLSAEQQQALADLSSRFDSGSGIKVFWAFYILSLMEGQRAGEQGEGLLLVDVDVRWGADPVASLAAKCRQGHDMVVAQEMFFWRVARFFWQLNSGLVYLRPSQLARALLGCMVHHVVEVSHDHLQVLERELQDIWPLLLKYNVTNTKQFKTQMGLKWQANSYLFDQNVYMDCLRNLHTGESRMRYTYHSAWAIAYSMLAPHLPRESEAGAAEQRAIYAHRKTDYDTAYDTSVDFRWFAPPFGHFSWLNHTGFTTATLEAITGGGPDPSKRSQRRLQGGPHEQSIATEGSRVIRSRSSDHESMVCDAEGLGSFLMAGTDLYASTVHNWQKLHPMVRHCVGKHSLCLFDDV